jgi:translation initiation factor IF-3
MDYGKFIYQQNKKQSTAKKKQKVIQTKRLRLRLTIEEGDYQVKLRNLIRFINNGDKVEISMRFRGREAMHKDLGMDLLQRVKADIAEHAAIEREPSFDGRQMMMILVPKKT